MAPDKTGGAASASILMLPGGRSLQSLLPLYEVEHWNEAPAKFKGEEIIVYGSMLDIPGIWHM